MGAVDVEIGAGARIQRGVGIFPVRVAWYVGGCRQAVEITELPQVGELVLSATGVVVVLVEVARLRPDRMYLAVHPVLRVAAGGLALVRHHVVEATDRAWLRERGCQ